jgi:glutaredoxin
MKLFPFVFEEGGKIKNSQHFDCFDESSPCVLEQYSACMIQDSNSQSKYVPWLICMDTDGENKGDVRKCSEQVGVDYSTISTCQKTQGVELLRKLVKEDAHVNQTPTVFVNGKNISPKSGPDYKTVKAAICKDDPTLKGCAGEDLLVG